MKITIIGGAGVRVPLVTNGLLRFHADLATEELALWDTDGDRRTTIARVSRAMVQRLGGSLRISTPATLEEALEGAAFVISSIRVGGLEGRIRDERIALEHGTLGQETVGAGGFALALRTIPVMVDYARQVCAWAPGAWLINFTNPVGIISQALTEAGVGERAIGVCDTPREQFESLARLLQVPAESVFFDYLGLNHLGWIRRLVVNGSDRMPELLQSEGLQRAYHAPFFEPGFLRELGLFPTEYLYFYYSPKTALEKTLASGNTRGQLIQVMEASLMEAVEREKDDPEAVLNSYDHYLASRNATYMAVETGEPIEQYQIVRARDALYQSAAGYERIAIDVMRAVRNNRKTVMPVDVANRGAIQDLEEGDSVEVPCVVDGNGARPLAAGRLPGQIRELTLQVKNYERFTVEAALKGSAGLAEDALAANPIIENRRQAAAILQAYRRAHAPHLDYLR